jgi:uncharacterized damage-inducible protein DinB
MNNPDIATLVAYNFWADERILAACEGLTAAEFTQAAALDPGWGSLRGILVHALDAETGWRAVLQGQGGGFLLQESDFADVAALRDRWAVEREAWLDFAAGPAGEQLDRVLDIDDDFQMTVRQVITHVVIHGAHHRAEAAAILTSFGRSPGDLDFDVFLFQAL